MTGRLSRRDLLRGAAALVALAGGQPAGAAEYASAADALAAIAGFETDVDRYLLRLHRTVPTARRMIDSFRRDRARHQADRARVARRLGLAHAASVAASEAATAPLDAVREAQAALVYAHAEALPTLGGAPAVGILMGNMIDLARHLTLLDLWIEAEAARG